MLAVCAWFYKQAVSTEACARCPVSTYRVEKGATELSNCQACPAGADTGGHDGQTSPDACQCAERFYVVNSGADNAARTCVACPSGATCANGFCALRTEDKRCPDSSKPIPGTWERSTSVDDAGRFRLTGCPPGFQTKTDSHDAQTCHPCLQTQYIINPNENACEKCPPGLICFGTDAYKKVVENSTWFAENGVYHLASCPTGYQRMSIADGTPADQQQCTPCPAGSECTLEVCDSCDACAAGKYKDTDGTQACRDCPRNTFNPDTNSKSFANCKSCPAGAETGGKVGQTNPDDCRCSDRTYLVTQLEMRCLDCPVGAECFDRSCALRSVPFTCTIIGEWIADPASGEYSVVSCPVGFQLQNASTLGLNIGCFKCPNGFYVHDSKDPTAVCRKCPSSATCTNGRPPVFNAAKMQGETDLALPDECNDETVRQALAEKFQMEASKIVLSSNPCVERRTVRKVTFQIVSNSEELDALQKSLSKIGVMLGEVQSEGPEILEGEVWEEIDGVYYLRQCPPGHLLINTTVELQRCEPCLPGTYLLEGSSECTKCPEGESLSNTVFGHLSHVLPCFALTFPDECATVCERSAKSVKGIVWC